MNGTTTKAAPAGAAISAKDLAKLSGERDRAIADLAARTAERDQAASDLSTVTGERDELASTVDLIAAALTKVGVVAPDGEKLVDHIAASLERIIGGAIVLKGALLAGGFLLEGETVDGKEVDPMERVLVVISEHNGLKAGLEAIEAHIVALDLQPTEGKAPLLDMIDTLIARVPVLSTELAAAQADLAAATKATDKAKADLRVAKAQAKAKSTKARPIGEIKGEQPRGEDLLTLIGAAETVELVFSDGKREVTALAPQLIEGDAWYQAANGVRLRVPSLLIHGPGRDDQALQVAGYGLVLDGELTAYAARMDVLTIQPGSQHQLKDDVIFN